MTMSDTIMVISIILGLGISLTSIGLLFAALFPAWVARGEGRLRAMPVRTTMVGLVLGGTGTIVSVVLMNAPVAAAKLVGLFGFFAVLLVCFVGAAGLARFIGSRLPSPEDAARPWKAVIRGWAVLYLASVLPVIGWFLFLPLALFAGFGAAVLGMFAPQAAPLPVAKPEVVA